MKDLKAIGQYIIVEELFDGIKKTKGGLELNEKVREDIRYRKGQVVSLGTDINIEGLSKKSLIMFDRSAGHAIDIKDQTFKVITLRDVCALIRI